jgi:putative spermidine/putrescine transport system ATP-binding protein
MATHLALSGLSKHYGKTVAVADATLEIAKGEAVALLGPSGCGKTTTLRMVAGLVPPTTGMISVMGRDITQLPAYKRNMGYVFQSYALFPHMSVAANVGFGLDERGVNRVDRDRKVRETLELVRLVGLEDRRPRELSGGQQQRVALARALVIAPDVLLLDESLSNLDAKLRDAMRIEIRDLQRKLAITTLFVTHDQTEALTLCDRVAVMNAGRIEQIASPRDIYDHPSTRFVADFVGRSSVLSATAAGEGLFSIGGSHVRAASTLPLGQPCSLYLRPQRLHLAPLGTVVAEGSNRLIGQVASHVFVGERLEILVDTPAGRIVVEVASGTMAPDDGAEVAVIWAVEDTLVFAGAVK